MARRAGRGFVRGPRRAMDWSASTVETSLTAMPASSVLLAQTFAPIVGGETAIRIRGLFSWITDQDAAEETQLGAVGIAVVTAQAVSVGITAVPTPNTDAAWGGWMWHSYFSSKVVVGDATGFQINGMNHIVIDSKAMRKVDEDERLVVVVENSAAFGILIGNSIRILSKVH